MEDALNELEQRLSDLSWTPGRKDFAGIFELVVDQKLEKEATRALLRAGDLGCEALMAATRDAEPPARGRLAKVLQRFAAQDFAGARAFCVSLLADDDAHTRRMAIGAVGQWGETWAEDLEGKLLEIAESADEATRRAVVRALEKIGGERTQTWLAAQELGHTAIVERRISRTGQSGLNYEAVLATPMTIEIQCKPGLEEIVVDQLKRVMRGTAKKGFVQAKTVGPLRLPLESRSAMSYEFVLPPAQAQAWDAGRIADWLATGPAQVLFKTFGAETVRFRLNWVKGKHRALTRDIAQILSERHPWLVNDPVERDFEVHLDLNRMTLRARVAPRVEDTRFAWRVADVPASSHPTVAATLVYLSQPRANDVVWDPFMGAGLELVERAKHSAYTRLIGSDIDADAIAAARANFASAGVSVEVHQGDATTLRLPPLNVILCNPPLGWRVHEEESVKALMWKFLPHAARLLKRGGRLVWTTRFAEYTDGVARQAGFDVQRSFEVDLGGLKAHMQVLVRI